MREIKFRAWHHGGGDPRVTGKMNYSYPFIKNFWINVVDEPFAVELMQYTGLKDKNGKEIYEGDIVRIPNNGISEVKWNYGEWNVEDFSNNAGSNNIYNFLTSDIEIIGNIYENPELLDNK